MGQIGEGEDRNPTWSAKKNGLGIHGAVITGVRLGEGFGSNRMLGGQRKVGQRLAMFSTAQKMV